MSYQVKLPLFEGPLDLLLNLIEKEKLEINKLSVSTVTDEYLKRVNQMKESSGEIADFLEIASKLLYIKSKSVLPNKDETEEEENIYEDLEKQLLEYKKYKEAALKMEKILERNLKNFEVQVEAPKKRVFVPPENIEISQLTKLFESAITEFKKSDEKHKKEKFQISIEDKIEEIKKIKKCTFRELVKSSKTKAELIVSFLAIMEALKRKIIILEQKDNFSDILIKRV